MTKHRVCITCGETKPSSEFYCYPYTTGAGNLSRRFEPRCRGCAKARRIERYKRKLPKDAETLALYRSENRERLNASLAAYRAANPAKVRAQRVESECRRRIAKSGKKMGLVAQVLDEYRIGDKYWDAYACELIEAPTVDHINPLSRGGSHSYDNLCVTSLSNNSSKRNQPLLLWLLKRAA